MSILEEPDSVGGEEQDGPTTEASIMIAMPLKSPAAAKLRTNLAAGVQPLVAVLEGSSDVADTARTSLGVYYEAMLQDADNGGYSGASRAFEASEDPTNGSKILDVPHHPALAVLELPDDEVAANKPDCNNKGDADTTAISAEGSAVTSRGPSSASSYGLIRPRIDIEVCRRGPYLQDR